MSATTLTELLTWTPGIKASMIILWLTSLFIVYKVTKALGEVSDKRHAYVVKELAEIKAMTDGIRRHLGGQ